MYLECVLQCTCISFPLQSLPMLKSYFQKAQYAILLSGTPALSRPIELLKQVEFVYSSRLIPCAMSKYLVLSQLNLLWTLQLEALYPKVYKSVHEYGNRYCKGVRNNGFNHQKLVIYRL